MAENLKVTCKLFDGRVNSADGLFFLDSILYHAWFKKYAPEIFEEKVKRKDNYGYIGLPIAKDEDGRYLASCGFYHQYFVTTEYWNKRTDMTVSDNYKYIKNPKGLVVTSKGEFKNYHSPQIIRTIGDVEFYCVGNMDKIKKLLSYMDFIGKKPSVGWGMVKEWIVEPFEYDWSTYSENYGIMRPIVLDSQNHTDIINLNKYTIMDCGIKPPYWKPKNSRLCAIPRVQI